MINVSSTSFLWSMAPLQARHPGLGTCVFEQLPSAAVPEDYKGKLGWAMVLFVCMCLRAFLCACVCVGIHMDELQGLVARGGCWCENVKMHSFSTNKNMEGRGAWQQPQTPLIIVIIIMQSLTFGRVSPNLPCFQTPWQTPFPWSYGHSHCAYLYHVKCLSLYIVYRSEERRVG